MSRSFRILATWSLAVTVGVAVTTVTANAQSTDSTLRQPPGRGGVGPQRGMGPRSGAFGPRGFADDGGGFSDRGPRAGMRGRRLEGARDRFGTGARGMGAARRARAGYLMRGITLSADQEKALRTNQARQITTTKPFMLELLSARTDQQLARLNGDQRALDAATARISTARTKLDSLREMRSPVEELRGILTPEQQKLLDRNLSEAAQQRGRLGPARGDGEGTRGLRPGAGPRGFRDAPFPPRRGGDDAADGDGDSDLDAGLFEWFSLDDADDPIVPPFR
jgi:hypothetical protein